MFGRQVKKKYVNGLRREEIVKRVIIYGAGNNGTKLVNRLCLNGDKKIIELWVDKEKKGTVINDILIVSPEKLDSIDKNFRIVITLSNIIEAQKIVINCKNKGFDNIYILSESVINGELPVIDDEGNFYKYVKCYKEIKPTLPYLEYQVQDNCNLKCKSCGHFSNIIKDDIKANLHEFEESCQKLSKVFLNIQTIRLMGGEPFLNPELGDFVKVARNIFPYADIRIVTNGLLIFDTTDDLWEMMRSNGVVLDISYYPVLEVKLPEIMDYLDNLNIRYILSRKVENFFVNLSRNGSENSDTAFNEYCLSKMCHFLRNRRLYACPRIPLVYENKEFLKIDISKEEIFESSVDVNNMESGWDVLEHIYKPVKACRICTKARWEKWELGGSNVNPSQYFA